MKTKFFVVVLLASCDSVDYMIDGVPQDHSWESFSSKFKAQVCEDCAVYASMATTEIQFNLEHNTKIELSEREYNSCHNLKCGDRRTTREVLSDIRDYGATLASDYSGNCEARVPRYSFKRYAKLINPVMDYATRREILVRALQSGPLAIEITNWIGFIEEDDALRCVSGTVLSPHAVSVVGYENYGEIFTIKNSGGEGRFLRVGFAEGERCGFADVAHQIMPGTTFTY